MEPGSEEPGDRTKRLQDARGLLLLQWSRAPKSPVTLQAHENGLAAGGASMEPGSEEPGDSGCASWT